jgi:hypothetical protein
MNDPWNTRLRVAERQAEMIREGWPVFSNGRLPG